MMNKRGIFFTVLTILMLYIFLISYTAYSNVEEKEAIRSRVETLNNFVFSLENDISRQIFISGFRGLLSLDYYVTSKGEFLTSTTNSLKEAILNGTINGENISLMSGFTLQDWKARINSLGDQQNVVVNYSIEDASVSQDDPWNVKIEVFVHLVVEDKGKVALFDKENIIEAEVSIEGFEDSFYLINTNGLVPNKIIRSNFSHFVSGSDVSNLTNHSTNSFYIASSSAPSFLDRLEGKTTANPNGIESLVNLNELFQQGLAVKSKSNVDYIYFSSSDPTSYLVSGMPAWFRLDNESNHLEIYEAGGLII